jgi:hypothetical protein
MLAAEIDITVVDVIVYVIAGLGDRRAGATADPGGYDLTPSGPPGLILPTRR